MKQSEKIGAYEAKTKLPEFLRKVVAGGRFTITQHGQPVAELIPIRDTDRTKAVMAARRMRSLMGKRGESQPTDIKALIEEGRD